ncbi:MAG: tetratricopeptide repeat protein [Cyanobacteria bacterium J06638_20]
MHLIPHFVWIIVIAIGLWFSAGTHPARALHIPDTTLATFQEQSPAISDSFQAGVAAYQAGHFQDAVLAFSDMLKAHPLYLKAYGNRCLAYLQLAEYDRAIADCTDALKLNAQDGSIPTSANTELYLNRGLAYYRLAKYGQAIADFDAILATLPDYRAFYNRGLAKFALQQYALAIADYDQSIRHSPSLSIQRLATVYDDRAIAYLALQQADKAIVDLTQAIALRPSDQRAFFNRACAHHQQGEYLLALQDFQQVLALDPNHFQAQFNVGLIHRQLGHRQQAYAFLKEAAMGFYENGEMVAFEAALEILQQLQTDKSAIG